MPERPRQADLDYDDLAELLRALAYPTRLELLDALRSPHTLRDIRLPPRRLEPGANPDRPAARQTVRAHLGKLVEAGLVRQEQVEREGKDVPSYAVNPQRLYALTEQLRQLSTIHAGHGRGGDATGTLGGAPRVQRARGPRLVLVHGVYEGKAFPLAGLGASGGRWVIGRARGLAVSLDYDPFVSLENAAITERSGAYELADLRSSKNGTSLNWAQLPRGGAQELETGDHIGVGRSLLAFYQR